MELYSLLAKPPCPEIAKYPICYRFSESVYEYCYIVLKEGSPDAIEK